jgi:hypothetical protein
MQAIAKKDANRSPTWNSPRFFDKTGSNYKRVINCRDGFQLELEVGRDGWFRRHGPKSH